MVKKCNVQIDTRMLSKVQKELGLSRGPVEAWLKASLLLVTRIDKPQLSCDPMSWTHGIQTAGAKAQPLWAL